MPSPRQRSGSGTAARPPSRPDPVRLRPDAPPPASGPGSRHRVRPRPRPVPAAGGRGPLLPPGPAVRRPPRSAWWLSGNGPPPGRPGPERRARRGCGQCRQEAQGHITFHGADRERDAAGDTRAALCLPIGQRPHWPACLHLEQALPASCAKPPSPRSSTTANASPKPAWKPSPSTTSPKTSAAPDTRPAPPPGSTQTGTATASITPARAVRARQAPAKARTTAGSGRGAAAFQQGVQAPAQYVEREGGGLPSRRHVEHLPGAVHRTGQYGWPTSRQRRDRLDAGQLRALADLGVQWAQ